MEKRKKIDQKLQRFIKIFNQYCQPKIEEKDIYNYSESTFVIKYEKWVVKWIDVMDQYEYEEGLNGKRFGSNSDYISYYPDYLIESELTRQISNKLGNLHFILPCSFTSRDHLNFIVKILDKNMDSEYFGFATEKCHNLSFLRICQYLNYEIKPQDIITHFFQIIYSLAQLQYLKIIHFDLSLKNIFIQDKLDDELKEKKFFQYVIQENNNNNNNDENNEISIIIKNPGYTLKIADFGFAQVWKQKKITLPIYLSDSEQKNHFKEKYGIGCDFFDPHYDVLFFMKNFFINLKFWIEFKKNVFLQDKLIDQFVDWIDSILKKYDFGTIEKSERPKYFDQDKVPISKRLSAQKVLQEMLNQDWMQFLKKKPENFDEKSTFKTNLFF